MFLQILCLDWTEKHGSGRDGNIIHTIKKMQCSEQHIPEKKAGIKLNLLLALKDNLISKEVKFSYRHQ